MENSLDNDILLAVQESENHITHLHNIIDKLKDRNKELEVKNETWERISNSNDMIEMSAVAKVLNYKGVGRNKLFKILREVSILRYKNEPYQQFVDREFFGVIEQEVSTEFGTIVNKKTVVTQKGIDFIRKTLDKYLGE